MTFRNFDYVPSAYFPKRTDYGIYVRYRRPRNTEIEVTHTHVNYTEIKCPDRDLCIVRDVTKSGAPRAWGKYDEFINLGYHSSSVKDMKPNYFMTNYTAYKDKAAPEFRKHMTNRPRIISDSGGYQILTNKEHFIDPTKLGEWVSKHVDESVVLDIPISHYYTPPDLLKRIVALQKESIKRTRAVTKDNTRLFNVYHGYSYQDVAQYADAVDRPYFDAACIPLYMDSAINGTNTLHHILTQCRPLKQYHLLGLFNPSFMPILLKFLHLYNGQAKDKVYVTSDSTSATKFSINGGFYKQIMHYMRIQDYRIGRTMQHDSHNPQHILPCNCLVCGALKYVDVYKKMSSSELATLLGVHNYHSMANYVDLIDHHARTMSESAYLAYAATQYAKASRRESLEAIKFVYDIFERGIEKAEKSHTLSLGKSVDGSEYSWVYKANLFKGQGTVTEDTQLIAVKKVVERYERFYETGIVPTEKNTNKVFHANSKALKKSGKKGVKK